MKVQKTKVAFFGLLSATLLTISCSKDKVEATPIPSQAATYASRADFFTIPDRSGTTISNVASTINVQAQGIIGTPSKISIELLLHHSNADDLIAVLNLPSGENITLFRNAGSDNNFIVDNPVTFSSVGTVSLPTVASNIDILTATYKQSFNPINSNLIPSSTSDLIDDVLINKNITGNWTLKIYDTKTNIRVSDYNFLFNWKIKFAEGALK